MGPNCFQLRNSQLHIRSRKAPTPEGFSEHSSKLETYTNNAFFIHWNQGKVEKILLPKDQPLSLTNLKKGIASVFQVTKNSYHNFDLSFPQPHSTNLFPTISASKRKPI